MNLKINLCVQVILVIFVGTFEKVSCYDNSCSRVKKRFGPIDEDPLFITPLLHHYKTPLGEIRARAKVTLKELGHLESYSGFFNVSDEGLEMNLFFWYFPAKVDPANAPVVLYLEGALHKDMFFGIFEQNGPIKITINGSLVERTTSWNRKHHIIYMESLPQTGYSSTKYKDPEMRMMSWSLIQGLKQFFKVFDSLQERECFLVGSYNVGRLLLEMGYYIDYDNRMSIAEKKHKINLQGVAIANGLIDPLNQFNFGEYLYEIGLIDSNGRSQFLAYEEQIKEAISMAPSRDAYHILEKLIIGNLSLFNELTHYTHPFNILKDGSMPATTHISNWIQRADARCDLHIGNLRYEQRHSWALDYLSKEMTNSGMWYLKKFLEAEKQYRLLIYTGNFDILCSYPSVHKLLLETDWPGHDEFKNADRILWHSRNNDLAGYKTKARGLTEVLVRNAGHFTSIDQPQWTLELLESFTDGSL